MSTPSHSLAAVRAADLLVLHVDFYNLVPMPGAAKLRRKDPAAPAHVVLRFPSQHLLEETFLEQEDKDDRGQPLLALLQAAGGAPVALARALGAAPSRVAFTVSEEVDEVPATLEQLLDFLAGCRLNVVGTAEGPVSTGVSLWPKWLAALGLGGWTSRGEKDEEPRRPSLVEPGPGQTAIELPYRLILSPRSRAGFAHATTPVLSPGLDRVGLWHSRLGLEPRQEGTPGDHAERTVRAVWVRSGGGEVHWDPADASALPTELDDPFVAALTERKRHEIAHRTSNYWQRLETAPVEVERLALSALGGWLDATGRWPTPLDSPLKLEEWTNRTAQGRDHYVKVVTAGYLYPFGHRASLIAITERKWQEDVPGRPAALRKRYFVIVREPEVRFADGAAQRLPRQMPLKRVRLRTLVTPVITPPASKQLFRVTVRNQPFRFAIEGEDEREPGEPGNITQFTMPLVFVEPPPRGSIDFAAASKALSSGDAPVADNAHRTDLGGSSVKLVPERPGEAGATSFPVAEAAFDAEPGGGTEAGFHPKLVDATVALPAVEIVTSRGATEKFEYAAAYVKDGFGSGNPGEVFAKLPNPPQLGLGGAAREAGGLAAPAIAIGGLSRALGPLGGTDLDRLAAAEFDPAKFFAGALGGAKLFGVFSLEQVISAAGLLDEVGGAPKLITKQLQGGSQVAEWNYSPKLQPYPTPADASKPKDAEAIFAPDPSAGGLMLHAQIEATGTQPQARVECTLTKVELRLPPGEARCIVIPIERIRLLAVAGEKLDVDVELGRVGFAGPLEFVNTLRTLIPEDGFSDPPALEVTPEGISSGFSIALPDVAIGIFALQHVSLGARFELPFIGPPPSFAFNFCTRNEPFLLTVSAFGGGGFFLVKLDPNGMQRLEASFEFGASVSMNFGVASGGVHVMAGVYFMLDTGGAVLTGYFRAGGNVSVLGIVSISIELYLGLTYETKTKKAIGRASLTVEVELFLFSASVKISCEREFSGGAGDPPLVDLLTPYPDPDEPSHTVDPWADYCRAYA